MAIILKLCRQGNDFPSVVEVREARAEGAAAELSEVANDGLRSFQRTRQRRRAVPMPTRFVVSIKA